VRAQPVHDTFQFSPSDPQCEEAAFNRAAARINELGNLYNNVSSFGEFSKIQGAAKDYVTRCVCDHCTVCVCVFVVCV
jgi:hypothetical protein